MDRNRIVKETDNVIFYKNKFGGIDFRVKPKNPDDIITAVLPDDK